mmetsp:Transcript_49578/g.153067  ORF Transcript_49578/g.153067 Transcript_49578/m.153067 type:complete len:265 (-) Transcript_49578:15-809(-)
MVTFSPAAKLSATVMQLSHEHLTPGHFCTLRQSSVAFISAMNFWRSAFAVDVVAGGATTGLLTGESTSATAPSGRANLGWCAASAFAFCLSDGVAASEATSALPAGGVSSLVRTWKRAPAGLPCTGPSSATTSPANCAPRARRPPFGGDGAILIASGRGERPGDTSSPAAGPTRARAASMRSRRWLISWCSFVGMAPITGSGLGSVAAVPVFLWCSATAEAMAHQTVSIRQKRCQASFRCNGGVALLQRRGVFGSEAVKRSPHQ